VADDDHILISLEPRHAENLLDGRKRVELRRHAMNVSIGSTVWMYAKLPVGSIIGRAITRLFMCLHRQRYGSDLVRSLESPEANSSSTSLIETKGSLWNCPIVGA
jgi:predicted transcriptional regulator